MFFRSLILSFLVLGAAVSGFAETEISARRLELIEGSTPWLRSPAPTREKAAVDTFYVLGGPDRLDGKFQNANGAPDWQGWTHHDVTAASDNHWHISDYWAADLNGHGSGNLALVCVDEQIPACSETDTVGGVGNNWMDDITWSRAVANPTAPVTVRLTAFVHYDLADIDWDFLELFIYRGTAAEMLGQWTGTDYDVALDFSTVLQPSELGGPGGDEVKLFWRVWSDQGYNDIDCKSPSHGAAQIDDISIYFNGELIDFYDFESGVLTDWTLRDFSGVGDFTNLRGNLPDEDPCRQNTSIQVNFIDDGLVVPGTGGTYCQTWCYGPGGYIVNNDGGLLADDTRDWFLKNEIHSPAMPWIPGTDAAELNFDVYRHETLCSTCPGMFYYWGVRSTASADPADLELAPWMNRNFLLYGGPDYHRQIEPVSDLIVQDAKWVQVMIGVDEAGWIWGWNGLNGTPAPYFDNVALKAWASEGPEILVRVWDSFSDSFPEQGSLDPVDLASNWCRIDAAQDIDYGWENLRFDAADSLIATIEPLRTGATLAGMPQMQWVMDCNPNFDAVRPVAPGGDGILRGSVLASEVYSGTTLLAGRFAFDLPDTGWFFPGDRLRYYITATDDIAGDLRTSVWPADTTGVLDFGPDSSYPDFAEIRALPTLSLDGPGVFSQPTMLYWDDAGEDTTTDQMLRSFTELGYVQGVDYDHFKTRSTAGSVALGLAASATPATLDGYDTVLLEAGRKSSTSISGDADSNDEELFEAWLDLGGKNVLLSGDGLIIGMNSTGYLLLDRLGVTIDGSDISDLNGGSHDLRINPLSGNGILPEGSSWMVNAICPLVRYVDAIGPGASSASIATLDPAGQTGGLYAAAIAHVDTVLNNRVAILPFSFRIVTEDPDQPATGEPNFTGRARLMKYLLDWFGKTGSGPYSALPEAKALSVQAAPNPFNPRTTIEFDLPRSAAVTLEIYDIQGRRVRQLLNETMAAGPHNQVWNGRDSQGKQASSGLYFYRFRAGDQERLGKLTLLK